MILKLKRLLFLLTLVWLSLLSINYIYFGVITTPIDIGKVIVMDTSVVFDRVVMETNGILSHSLLSSASIETNDHGHMSHLGEESYATAQVVVPRVTVPTVLHAKRQPEQQIISTTNETVYVSNTMPTAVSSMKLKLLGASEDALHALNAVGLREFGSLRELRELRVVKQRDNNKVNNLIVGILSPDCKPQYLAVFLGSIQVTFVCLFVCLFVRSSARLLVCWKQITLYRICIIFCFVCL